tara:strand:+ start:604 stop:4380 length:3777 start_codon:yes stop_codon:yes gene_type:complete
MAQSIPFTDKLGNKRTMTAPDSFSQTDIQRNIHKYNNSLDTPEEKAEATKTEPAAQEVDTPSLGRTAGALSAEIAIAGAGQALAPFTGIFYPVVAAGSGFVASVVAQNLEGREDFSLGRAIAAAGINTIPFSNSLKVAKATALASGKTLTGKQLLGAAAIGEGKRGAALGLTESVATSVIDTGELPDASDAIGMTLGGMVIGGSLGTGIAKATTFSTDRAVNKVLNKIKGKSAVEIDNMIANNTITPLDLVSITPAAGNLSGVDRLKQASRLANDVKLSVKTKAQVNTLTELSLMNEPTTLDNIRKVFNPKSIIGRESTEAAFSGTNIHKANMSLGHKMALQVEGAVKENPNLRKHINEFLDTAVMPDSIKGTKLEGTLIKYNEEIYKLETSLFEQLGVHRYGDLKPFEQDLFRAKIDKHRIHHSEADSSSKSYTTRQYQLFENPDFVPEQNLVDDAVASLTRTFQRGDTSLNKKPLPLKEATQKAEEEVNSLISKSAKNVQNNGESSYKSSSNAFTQRKVLSPELRKMMGEITEPADRIRGSMTTLSRIVSQNTSDMAITKTLIDSGMAVKKSTVPPSQQQMYRPLKLKTKLQYSKDVDVEYIVPQEVQNVIDYVYLSGLNDKNTNAASKIWNSFIGVSKATKVILNPPSYFVNAYGAMSTMMGMGMNPFSKGSYKGFKLAMAEYDLIHNNSGGKTAISNKAYLDAAQDMRKYGLADGNVDIGDMRSNIEKIGSVGEVANKFVEPFSKAYQATDIAARFGVWTHNQKRLSKMFPDLKEGSDELKEAAARLTNDTFQNYNKLPQAIRDASRLGILPPFVAFTAEFSRNIYKQARYATQMANGSFGKDLGIDVSNINKTAMRKEGFIRLGALSVVSGGTAFGIAANNTKEGVSSEKEEAIDDVALPQYLKGTRQAFIGFDNDNKTMKYINPMYVIPHTIIPEVLAAGYSLKDLDPDKLGKIIAKNFVGTGNFPMRAAYEGISNKDEYGNPISDSEVGLEKTWAKLSYFTAEVLRTGAQRELAKGLDIVKKGEDSDLSWWDLVRRQGGIRIESKDITEQATYNIRDVVGRMNNNGSPYKRKLKDFPNMDSRERQILYQESNKSRKQSFEVLTRNYNSLKKIGYTEDESIAILKDSGVGGSDLLGVLAGKYVNIDFEIDTSTSQEYEDLYQGQSYSEVMRGISPLRRTDPLRYKRLRSYAKQVRDDDRKNISGKEKLIRGLSVEKRARYVIDNPSEERDLMRKRIITSDVRREIRRLRSGR